MKISNLLHNPGFKRLYNENLVYPDDEAGMAGYYYPPGENTVADKMKLKARLDQLEPNLIEQFKKEHSRRLSNGPMPDDQKIIDSLAGVEARKDFDTFKSRQRLNW